MTSEITLISSVRINCYTTSSAKFVLSSRNRRSPPAGFSYIQKDALHDDLIVAWRVTGGSEEVRKEGRGAKGAPGVCHKGEMNAWALNVNGRSAREKKRGESSELWQMSIPRHARHQGFLSRSHEKSDHPVPRYRFIVSEI